MPSFHSPAPALTLLSLALCVSLLGCSNDTGPKCYPVSGIVLLDGQPLAEAEVVFHPPADLERKFPKPIAQTDVEGRFRLTTQQPFDGAPVGEYSVTIELREPRQAGEEMVRDGANLLPPRYASPTESGLRFTVTTGTNAVPTIELQNR